MNHTTPLSAPRFSSHAINFGLGPIYGNAFGLGGNFGSKPTSTGDTAPVKANGAPHSAASWSALSSPSNALPLVKAWTRYFRPNTKSPSSGRSLLPNLIPSNKTGATRLPSDVSNRTQAPSRTKTPVLSSMFREGDVSPLNTMTPSSLFSKFGSEQPVAAKTADVASTSDRTFTGHEIPRQC